MIQLQVIFRFSLSIQICDTHIAWLMATTLAYYNRLADFPVVDRVKCKD